MKSVSMAHVIFAPRVENYNVSNTEYYILQRIWRVVRARHFTIQHTSSYLHESSRHLSTHQICFFRFVRTLLTKCTALQRKIETPLSCWCVLISANVHDRSSIWQIIEEAQEVGGQLRRLELVKISRVQNNLAHELAQFSITSRESQCFFACFPEWVHTLSCKDAT